MKLVEFNARKHYSEIRAWWGNQAWTSVDLEMLPKNGFVVELGETMICAGFLYSSDSSIAWMEFVVGNPQLSHTERGLGLNLLISGILSKARELGFKAVFTSTQHDRLLDRLVNEHGFIISDNNVTHLLKGV